MKSTLIAAACFLLLSGMAAKAHSQTKCIWIEKSENGSVMQRAGLSLHLLKLLATSKGTWTLDDTKMNFDSLMTIYKSGSTVRIEDSTGNGETRIFGGKFDLTMKEETERHNYLIVESTDSGRAQKITKVRVESIEAVGIVLAMIGSSNLDDAIDRIEAALDRGGVLYIRDYKQDSRLWIYVN